jgi:predicted RNA-binding Zn-ribbon protein involved in translation (DUF1610 family)/DNA-directed RNA polymerase subunit RPC12/RpoP
LASWFVTHIYSESQHQKVIAEVEESHSKNLRTYALKAAEKVNNLSNQLNRLSVYLEESLEDNDSANLRDNYMANQERIQSAIHIINTLKSVNDTALSDWEGVIGDELNEQRELQKEKEQELENLVERIESLSESQIDTEKYAQDSTENLARDLDSIRKDIRSMASSLGVTTLRLNKPIERKKKVEVTNPCPHCGQPISYRQREDCKSVKTMKCESCDTRLIATYDLEKKFILKIRSIVEEHVVCPLCKTQLIIELDNLPSSSVLMECTECHSKLLVTRATNEINVKVNNEQLNNPVINDEILKLVKDNLPAQPWPTGTSKAIAEKLNLPSRVVADAISKLVKKGELQLQYYGKLYVPKAKQSKNEDIKTLNVENHVNKTDTSEDIGKLL